MQLKPYVYKLTHRETGQFYIGYRANKRQNPDPIKDLMKYKSSSKLVKALGFENFDIEIIKEFESKTEAYDLEQKLIQANWNNELKLNGSYCVNDSSRRFTFQGHSEDGLRRIAEASRNRIGGMNGKKQSEEAKKKISEKAKLLRHTEEAKEKIRDAVIRHHKEKPRKMSEEAKEKIRQSLLKNSPNKGKKMSEEQKEKIRQTLLNKSKGAG